MLKMLLSISQHLNNESVGPTRQKPWIILTKRPQIMDETEWGQLIPQRLRLANKVVAAHCCVTLLNSLESTGAPHPPP